MTELVNPSTERSNETVACTVKLLHHYGFDLGGYLLSQLLLDWQQHYPTAWIRLAAIEALYQGRYKAISVEQILAMWQRRSQPCPHFNHEFERLVCANLPEHQTVVASSTQSESVLSRSTALEAQVPRYRVALQLPSFEGSPGAEADVMLALRTLHSKEMAALQEATLTEFPPPELQQPNQADCHPTPQADSYRLRSDEPLSPLADQEHNPPPAKGEEGQSIPSEDTNSTDIDGGDIDVNGTPMSDTTSSDEPSAQLSSPPDNEQAPSLYSNTDNRDPLSRSINEAQVRSPLPQPRAIAKILQQLEQQELKAKVDLPSLRLIASTSEPKLQTHLTPHYQPTWLTDPCRKQPIHQFTPTPEQSDFCSKLKAVAQPLEVPQENGRQPDS